MVVSDSSNIDTHFRTWSYERLFPNDFTGRPYWQYADPDNNIQSFVQYLSSEGWIVFINDGHEPTTYSTGILRGFYPPLDIPLEFNDTNDEEARIFTFRCLPTDFPTAAPSAPPTNYPTLAPNTNPTGAPTAAPHGRITPSPTAAPTDMPTVSPTVMCEALKIHIPETLVTNDNPNCDINFTAVFDSYWLQSISRSDRSSWTLDCDDPNSVYTMACDNGYSGQVFFISNQWEIQVHSKTDDCFERFVVDNTGSYFLPQTGGWLDESTKTEYQFTFTCTAKQSVPTLRPTGKCLFAM